MSFKAVFGVLAISAVTVSVSVAAPAPPASAVVAPAVLDAPDTVWTPPEDAAAGVVPDANVPEEPWAPAGGVAVERPDAKSSPDPGVVTPYSAPSGTVAGAPGVGELPWFSFEDFELAPDSSAQVNLANGNLLVKANDFAIAAPGYALRHDRFYNGLSTAMGSQGGGWRSSNGTYDIGVQNMGSYVDFFGPNGVTLRFTRVGSTNEFTSPDGSNMTLHQDSSYGTFAFVLTMNKTGEQLKFSGTGYLTASVDRNGVGEYYSYSTGNIISSYNDNGRGLFFTWNMDGFLEKVEDTAGRTVEYTYDTTAPRLKTVKSVDGKITSYDYDSTGRLSSITVPSAAGPSTTVVFTYDSSHRVTKVTQDGVTETEFAYSSGQTVVTDPNGNDAIYTIDSEGRVESTEDALGRTRSQTWTANSDIATSTDAIGTNTTTYTYDGSGNRTSSELPTGAAASAVYAIGPDCSAPNTGTAFQPKCSTDDAGNTTEYEYDSNGNLLTQTDTTGSTGAVEVEYSYTGCGGFTGQVCSSTDGNGNTTTYAYDGDGNLTTVTPPSPLGATTYTYDSLGRVSSVTDGNGDTTAYQYDVRDRIVLTTFNNGQNMVTTYYGNGLEESRTDSAGGATTYEYDAHGRLTEQTGPATGTTQTYTYDDTGNMITATDSAGTTTYGYDDANQLISLTEPGGTCPTGGTPAAGSGCILFAYDDNAAETTRTTPGGATITTSRDNAGRPTRITAKDAAGTTRIDIGYSYDAAGDDRANIQTRTSYKEQGITAGAVTAYTYDSQNRLTLAEETSGSTTTASWAYDYDDAGNRTSQTRTGNTGATAGTIDYTYNAANQLTGTAADTTTWTYDTAGNQTRNGITGSTATFGDRSETTTIDSTTADYFDTGNTNRQTLGSTTFTSSALGLTTSTTGSTTLDFTRTPDGAAIGYKATNRYYYIQDHLGSVVGILNTNGAYKGGYTYSPYGETRTTGTNAAVTKNPLRYISGHHDGNGIYKLGARYYDTSLGRFTQIDPTGQESNPYSYAKSDPVNGYDPSGTRWASALLEMANAAFDAWMNGTSIGEAIAGEVGWSDVVPSIVGGLVSGACFAGVTASATMTLGGTAMLGLGCGALGEMVGRTVQGIYYGEW